MIEKGPPPSISELLKRATSGMTPDRGARARVLKRMKSQMEIQPVSSALGAIVAARESIQPEAMEKNRVWDRISDAIGSRTARIFPLWERLRATLSPDSSLQAVVWRRLSLRLEPAYAHAVISRPMKLIAAIAVLVLIVRASPILFLAPPTVAQASVTVLPTRGDVSMLVAGLWQPLKEEFTVDHPIQLQTHDGEATIMLLNNAVIRMGSNTTLSLNQTDADPLVPSQGVPTAFLHGGEVWAFGLVPGHIEGVTIGTAEGRVVIHEGSVNVRQNGHTDIEVWDRSATIARRRQQIQYVAGQSVTLRHDEDPAVAQISADRQDSPWVTLNINRDAVHQPGVAQLQLERRAASAGFLPDSPWYGAKRAMERVDVLFTFSEKERAKKLIDQANTRLNEAAALIANGSESQAAKPLQEYRETLLQVASGSGGSSVVQSLIEQEVVVGAVGDVAVFLPDNDGYEIKEAVYDAVNALPDTFDKPDTTASEIFDALSMVRKHLQEGQVQQAKAELENLKPNLPVEGSDLSLVSPEMREEVEAAMFNVTAALESREQTSEDVVSEEWRAMELSLSERRALRQAATTSTTQQPRTTVEIAKEAREISNRIINTYNTHQGRMTQFRLEAERLQGDPDRGLILRQLELPEGLDGYTRNELRKIRAENETGSGACGSNC